MKILVGVFMVIGSVLAIGDVGFSDIVARTDRLFFAKPLPCHVYLKEKQSVETRSSSYVPGSFFQAQVMLLKLKPHVIYIQQAKKFLQAELDKVKVEAQQHPEAADNYAKAIKDIQNRLKDVEDGPKVIVLQVVETLEGPSPGEKITLPVRLDYNYSRYQAMIEDKMEWYVLGYQSRDGRMHGVTVSWNDRSEGDDGFLTDLKRWVRWLLSDCDNI